MRTLLLRLALVGALGTITTGLKCADGPLDDAIGPTIRTLNGIWQGPIDHLTMRLTLTESNGSVTGSGTMLENGVSFALSVSGTSSNGAFSLTIAEVEHAPFTYTGNLQASESATTLVGVANGSGFQNQPITLTKQ